MSAKTVRHWIDCGDVDGVYIGSRYYIRRAALDELLGKTNAPESEDSEASA